MAQPTLTTPTAPGAHLDLEAAIAAVRAAANPALPDGVLFNLETARELARHAPDLYDMGAGTRGRFTLIATFIGDALDALAPRQPATAPAPVPAPRSTTTPRGDVLRAADHFDYLDTPEEDR